MTNRFEKLSIALKNQLIGKGYTKALQAFAFAKLKHSRFRKDGVTPEFQHQLEIALYITTLKGIRAEEVTIASALLHDVIEDTGVDLGDLAQLFGNEVTDAVDRLTIKNPAEGWKMEPEPYYERISKCPIASIVKGCDRIHNVNTMAGVFTVEKQLSYIEEIHTYFLPMLKQAEHLFPDQYYAYMNIRHMLKSQAALVDASRLAGPLGGKSTLNNEHSE